MNSEQLFINFIKHDVSKEDNKIIFNIDNNLQIIQNIILKNFVIKYITSSDQLITMIIEDNLISILTYNEKHYIKNKMFTDFVDSKEFEILNNSKVLNDYMLKYFTYYNKNKISVYQIFYNNVVLFEFIFYEDVIIKAMLFNRIIFDTYRAINEKSFEITIFNKNNTINSSFYPSDYVMDEENFSINLSNVFVSKYGRIFESQYSFLVENYSKRIFKERGLKRYYITFNIYGKIIDIKLIKMNDDRYEFTDIFNEEIYNMYTPELGYKKYTDRVYYENDPNSEYYYNSNYNDLDYIPNYQNKFLGKRKSYDMSSDHYYYFDDGDIYDPRRISFKK